jgi:hypothetical protein
MVDIPGVIKSHRKGNAVAVEELVFAKPKGLGEKTSLEGAKFLPCSFDKPPDGGGHHAEEAKQAAEERLPLGE